MVTNPTTGHDVVYDVSFGIVNAIKPIVDICPIVSWAAFDLLRFYTTIMTRLMSKIHDLLSC